MTNSISFEKNQNLSNVPSSNIQTRINEGQNFGAIDKQKLQQDALELKKEAENNAKENFIFRMLKGLGINDPKKFFKALGLTLATVVGFALLGNKTANKMASAGLKVDDLLLNDKIYQGVSSFFKSAKEKIVKTLTSFELGKKIQKSQTIDRAKPRTDMARGYGRGFVSIFSLTPVDVLKKGLGDDIGDIEKAAKKLKPLVGDEAANIVKKLQTCNDNREFCSEFSKAIRKNFNCQNDNKKFYEILKKLQKGEDDFAGLFTQVDMVEKGFTRPIGSWWPVNLIDSVVKKVTKGKHRFCRGNLGDSLIKYNVAAGSLADTKIGSLVQKSILIPSESISNFVNDKSGMGVFLCSSIMSLYGNVLDAPKDKRIPTVADDFIGTVGSIAISTPMAFATTYGLASLKNLDLKDANLLTKILGYPLKGIGKFFGMGLGETTNGILKQNEKTWKNFLPRKFGGFMRFAMILMVLSPLFAKPIRAIIHKIFGKPYDPNEEEKKKQLEAQRNQMIPELGITQGEFMDKVQKNPSALQQLQTNPKLAMLINQNPKLILDLLDGKDLSNVKLQKPSAISPANKQFIDRQKMNQNAVQNNNYALNKAPKTNTNSNNQNNEITDSATYIPSSEAVKTSTTLSKEAQTKYDEIMNNADKSLKRAEQYI